MGISFSVQERRLMTIGIYLWRKTGGEFEKACAKRIKWLSLILACWTSQRLWRATTGGAMKQSFLSIDKCKHKFVKKNIYIHQILYNINRSIKIISIYGECNYNHQITIKTSIVWETILKLTIKEKDRIYC